MPQWLRGELKAFVHDMLSPRNLGRHDIFDAGTVARILDDHFDGRETNDTLIWSLVVFQVWYDLYLDAGAREPLSMASA
jgi:asparagine synthase (glutamine-hydrolysing)